MNSYLEIQHLSHRHHLRLESRKAHYKCSGCKEPGWGSRYRCEECDYDLHKDCAYVTPTMYHSFYENCFFEFLECSPNGRDCNACGRVTSGFVYHCYETGYDLHPCCAHLPPTLEGDGVELHLHESLSGRCGKCRMNKLWGKVRGWSYRSKSKKYHVHVSCVKDIVVGKWEKGHLSEAEMNNSAIETARVSSSRVANYGRARSRKRKIKYWKIAKVIAEVVISIIFGDPTGGIASLIGSLLIQ